MVPLFYNNQNWDARCLKFDIDNSTNPYYNKYGTNQYYFVEVNDEYS